MPEGPEVHREADRIRRALVGRRAEGVWFASPGLAPMGPRLAGREVLEVRARGKALLIDFAGRGQDARRDRRSIYSHNLLYGRWYVRRRGQAPKTRRSLRLAIDNAEHSALLYSASEIEVLTPFQLREHAYLSAIGPDPLGEPVTTDALQRRLDDARFARRRLAGLLLDQAFVAGIGNYLRSEILFVAGLHPLQRPTDLSPDQRSILCRAVLDVTRRAYRSGGVTNAPERARSLRRAGAGRADVRHYVFSRAGRECWHCGSRILRETAAGRRLYRCPHCQPVPSPRA